MQCLQRVISHFSDYPILQSFYDDLPNKPYCSDTKDYCKVRPKATASKLPYIQANHPNLIKWLVIDIDSDFKNKFIDYYDEKLFFRWHDRNLPMPTFIARNKKNGHVQYFIKLTNPVSMFENSRSHPVTFLKNLQYALTVQYGGDLSFGGSLSKNPLDCKTWDIYLTGAGSYTLNELAEYIDFDDPINKPPKRSANDEIISPFAGLGRNCDTFDYLRFIAYPIAHSMTQTALFNHLLKIGIEFNSRFKQPMLLNEIKCICRSIAKFCKTSPRYQAYAIELHERKANMGRIGGLKSDSSHGGKARSAKYDNKRQTAINLHEQGLNNTQIAQKLGVSRITVIRWLK